MKRLFEVCGKFFQSKMEAKDYRRKMNGCTFPDTYEAERKAISDGKGYTIKLGPDHWRYGHAR